MFKDKFGVEFSDDGRRLLRTYDKEIEAYTVPEGVVEIDCWAFRDCEKLQSIAFPASVNLVCEDAFANCSALTWIFVPRHESWAFKQLNGLKGLEDKIFEQDVPDADCCPDVEADFPSQDFIDQDGVRYGAEGTVLIRGNKSLKSYSIKGGTVEIGKRAFYGCENLRKIELPETIETIGGYAFAFCENLFTVNIPKSVTLIANSAFKSCSALDKVIVPSSVTELQESVFAGTGITTADIAASEIGDSAFLMCRHLMRVNLHDTVTKIEENAFSHCEALTEIVIPKGSKAKFAAMKGLEGLCGLLVEK